MPQIFPLINGVKYDYSSVEILIGGVRFQGVKSIDYSAQLEPGMAYGTSAQPAGRTRRQYSAEGSIEIYKADYADLLTLLTAGGQGYMEQSFPIIVTYGEELPAILMTDVLQGCRLKKNAHAGSEGSDPLVVKCDLSVMYLLENGKSPLTNLKLGGVL